MFLPDVDKTGTLLVLESRDRAFWCLVGGVYFFVGLGLAADVWVEFASFI